MTPDACPSTTLPAPAEARHAMPAPAPSTPAPGRLAHLMRRHPADGPPHPLAALLAAHHGAQTTGATGAQPPAAAGLPAPGGPHARESSATGQLLDLDQLARRVTELPPLPQALVAVMQALQRDHLSTDQSIQLIEQDPALAARTLRLANSAFYGVPGRVGSIADAVHLLGLRTVGGVLTAAAMHSHLKVDHCPGFRFEAYWRHALAAGLLARALGPRAGLSGDEAFLAGLMHDVGALVLAAFHPGPAAEVIQRTQAQDRPTHQVESELLGLHHGSVGALVARHWRFPSAIAHAIEHHHQVEVGPPDAPLDMTQLVQLADALAHGLDLNQDRHEAVPLPAAESWLSLGLDLEEGLALMRHTADGVQALSAALLAA